MLNVYVFVMLLSSFLAAVSQVMLKLSARKKYKHPLAEYLNPLVISAYIILLLTMVMNIYAYSGMDYKLGPILTTASYIFVVILSVSVLKEKISLKKALGVCMIIIGILVFSL